MYCTCKLNTKTCTRCVNYEEISIIKISDLLLIVLGKIFKVFPPLAIHRIIKTLGIEVYNMTQLHLYCIHKYTVSHKLPYTMISLVICTALLPSQMYLIHRSLNLTAELMFEWPVFTRTPTCVYDAMKTYWVVRLKFRTSTEDLVGKPVQVFDVPRKPRNCVFMMVCSCTWAHNASSRGMKLPSSLGWAWTWTEDAQELSFVVSSSVFSSEQSHFT